MNDGEMKIGSDAPRCTIDNAESALLENRFCGLQLQTFLQKVSETSNKITTYLKLFLKIKSCFKHYKTNNFFSPTLEVQSTATISSFSMGNARLIDHGDSENDISK